MTKNLVRFLATMLLLVTVPFAIAKEISFGIISTDAGVIEAMRFNKVQVAWYGNKAAMEAVDRANGEIFAQLMYADGTYGYHALLITHKDSPYKSLDDVFANGKNINFGIGDPNSTSGFLVPTYYIFSQRKVDPREVFKTVRNGSHGANIQAVLAKQLDVATNNTEDYGRLEATKPDQASQIRVIWKSPLIPSDPFVWRKDLDSASKEKIRNFVLNYAKTDPAEKQILKNIYNYGGFRASTNAQLNPIRQLELFKDRRKIESDSAMSVAEKTVKLAEIDKALAAIK